jgi:hypothetical protein
MEIGQYPKRVRHPCEQFDTESENDLAQGQQMPGAFKPPAPQAPVRYTCVQDLSEASLGSLLLCVGETSRQTFGIDDDVLGDGAIFLCARLAKTMIRRAPATIAAGLPQGKLEPQEF